MPAAAAALSPPRRERRLLRPCRLLRPRRARRDRPCPAFPAPLPGHGPGPAGTMQVSSRRAPVSPAVCGRRCESPAEPRAGAAPWAGAAGRPPRPSARGSRGGSGPLSRRSLGAEVAVTRRWCWAAPWLGLWQFVAFFLQLRDLFYYCSERVGVSGSASVC